MKCKICGKEIDNKPKRHITLDTPTSKFLHSPYSMAVCNDCVRTFVKAVAKCGDTEFSILAKDWLKEKGNSNGT